MFILGTKVHNFTMQQALKRAEEFLYDGKQHYIVTPNPEIVLHALEEPRYRMILNKADLSIPDGIGIVLASKVLYGLRKSFKYRISGVDFMERFINQMHSNLLGLSRRNKLGGGQEASDKTSASRVLLLGGRNGAARRGAEILKRKFHRLDFYALENINNKYIDFVINEVIQPECIFVGLGAPKQEQWIYENLSRFPTIKVAMGVGGSLDFISGHILRAPSLFRIFGVEWFWRLLLQPWRIKRVFQAVIIFPLKVLRVRFGK